MNLQERNRQKVYTEISRTCMVVSFCAILSIIACNCAGCFTTDKIKDDFYQQAQEAVELWHGAAKIETLNAIGPGNPTAEGPREHFAGAKPGGTYNAGTQVRAKAEGTTWVWTIAKTGSRNENLKAAKISEAGENR